MNKIFRHKFQGFYKFSFRELKLQSYKAIFISFGQNEYRNLEFEVYLKSVYDYQYVIVNNMKQMQMKINIKNHYSRTQSWYQNSFFETEKSRKIEMLYHV